MVKLILSNSWDWLNVVEYERQNRRHKKKQLRIKQIQFGEIKLIHIDFIGGKRERKETIYNRIEETDPVKYMEVWQ